MTTEKHQLYICSNAEECLNSGKAEQRICLVAKDHYCGNIYNYDKDYTKFHRCIKANKVVHCVKIK